MIILDVETTGVNPIKNSIVSIGAIDLNNPFNMFYGECRVWEGAEINPEALEVNGFTLDDVTYRNKYSLEELTIKFIEWLNKVKNSTIAGHNVGFDAGFLRDSIQRVKLKGYDIQANLGYRTIDLHSETYTNHMKNNFKIPIKDNRTNLTSDYAFNYVGLPDEPKPHNALTGAKMEAETLFRLIYGKKLLPDFNAYSIPEYSKK